MLQKNKSNKQKYQTKTNIQKHITIESVILYQYVHKTKHIYLKYPVCPFLKAFQCIKKIIKLCWKYKKKKVQLGIFLKHFSD